jgi:hypothetical protein
MQLSGKRDVPTPIIMRLSLQGRADVVPIRQPFLICIGVGKRVLTNRLASPASREKTPDIGSKQCSQRLSAHTVSQTSFCEGSRVSQAGSDLGPRTRK